VTGDGDGDDPEAGTVCDERFDAATLHLLRERVAACAAAAGVPQARAADVTLAVHSALDKVLPVRASAEDARETGSPSEGRSSGAGQPCP
jgi:hypothetical protein